MSELPKGYNINQAFNDIIYLGHRQRAMEEALEEWTEFITTEIFKQDVKLHKHKKTYGYFKESLKYKFKTDYEKMEGILARVNSLFDKKKKGRWLG